MNLLESNLIELPSGRFKIIELHNFIQLIRKEEISPDCHQLINRDHLNCKGYFFIPLRTSYETFTKDQLLSKVSISKSYYLTYDRYKEKLQNKAMYRAPRPSKFGSSILLAFEDEIIEQSFKYEEQMPNDRVLVRFKKESNGGNVITRESFMFCDISDWTLFIKRMNGEAEAVLMCHEPERSSNVFQLTLTRV